MLLNRKSLDHCSLYFILDAQVNKYQKLSDIAKQAIDGGADIIQFRAKFLSDDQIQRVSQEIVSYTQGQCPFIINDRVHLVNELYASGVHVGQTDMSYSQAREQLGDEKIIGVSCQTLEQAWQAQEQGADYIGFGSVYKTQTKPERFPMDPELLKRVVSEIAIPVFAIGGISNDHIKELKDLGVRRFAVCRAIAWAQDACEETRKLKKIIAG